MKRTFLIFSILLCFFSAFSKPVDEPQHIPIGQWALESIVAFDGNAQISFNTDDLDFEIPSEMNVQQDEITFLYQEGTTIINYGVVAKGHFLCFLVCAEWKMEGNKLMLQWIQDIDNPENVSEVRTIVLIYKLN